MVDVAPLADAAHDVVDERQRLEAEEVELDQADLVDVRAAELRHHAALFVDEEGQILDQRPRADDDAGGVLGGVAQQALELERMREQALLALALVAQLAQARLHLQGVGEREVLALLGRRVELGDLVGLAVGELEDAADVLDRRLPLQRPEGDDLRDVVLAVALAHVADHLVAALEAEVHVDVGHRLALRVEEALEEQVVRNRIEVGDAQRPRHDAARRRAAAGADRDALALRVVGEVGDDQEVAGEAHVLDHRQLGVDALLIGPLAFRVPVAERAQADQPLLESDARVALQLILERHALGRPGRPGTGSGRTPAPA